MHRDARMERSGSGSSRSTVPRRSTSSWHRSASTSSLLKVRQTLRHSPQSAVPKALDTYVPKACAERAAHCEWTAVGQTAGPAGAGAMPSGRSVLVHWRKAKMPTNRRVRRERAVAVVQHCGCCWELRYGRTAVLVGELGCYRRMDALAGGMALGPPQASDHRPHYLVVRTAVTTGYMSTPLTARGKPLRATHR